jgi:hypothetical protein
MVLHRNSRYIHPQPPPWMRHVIPSVLLALRLCPHRLPLNVRHLAGLRVHRRLMQPPLRLPPWGSPLRLATTEHNQTIRLRGPERRAVIRKTSESRNSNHLLIANMIPDSMSTYQMHLTLRHTSKHFHMARNPSQFPRPPLKLNNNSNLTACHKGNNRYHK